MSTSSASVPGSRGAFSGPISQKIGHHISFAFDVDDTATLEAVADNGERVVHFLRHLDTDVYISILFA